MEWLFSLPRKIFLSYYINDCMVVNVTSDTTETQLNKETTLYTHGNVTSVTIKQTITRRCNVTWQDRLK